MFAKKTWLPVMILVVILIVGAGLRLIDLTKNPVGLNIDEVSIGYSAYSILKTGKDEYGTPYPIAFRSVEDYKPPVLIYLTVPSVAILGLNEWAVRLPTAVISILSIWWLYLLLKTWTGDRRLGLIGAGLMAILPWHIYYSRYASESMVATSLLILGVYFLLKIRSSWGWAIAAAVALSLAMYAYHPHRLFIPLFGGWWVICNWRQVWLQKWRWLLLAGLAMILILPLAWSVVFGSAEARAQMTFIGNDIEFTRPVDVTPLNSHWGVIDNRSSLLFFYWTRKYLNYFHPDFLFANGLTMTTAGNDGLGVLYLFMLPFLAGGIYQLVRGQVKHRALVVGWILLGILPASLTQNEQHPLRSLLIMPMVVLLMAVGVEQCWVWFKRLKPVGRWVIGFGFGGLVVINLVQAWLIFTILFPNQKGEAFMEGSKQAAQYAIAHRGEYREIVFDPVRGVDGPFTVSIPHMYILFYSAYDPAKYQAETKRQGGDSFGFDKYTIRAIDWTKDRQTAQTLFIGSPWSLPEKDLSPSDIKQKIYLSNGAEALVIVAPQSPK